MVKVFRFTASWCQPCKTLAKILEQEGIDIPVYDIDQHPELARKYNIRSVPTIVIEQPNGDTELIVGASLSNYHKDVIHGILDASTPRS